MISPFAAKVASLKRLAWLYGCAPKGTRQEEEARRRLLWAIECSRKTIEDDLVSQLSGGSDAKANST